MKRAGRDRRDIVKDHYDGPVSVDIAGKKQPRMICKYCQTQISHNFEQLINHFELNKCRKKPQNWNEGKEYVSHPTKKQQLITKHEVKKK
jgi:hypothetical protein